MEARGSSTTRSRPPACRLDNAVIARIFAEIADLLEIRSENPFKIRAYRNAADIVVTSASSIAAMSDADIRAIPGIGRDLAG